MSIIITFVPKEAVAKRLEELVDKLNSHPNSIANDALELFMALIERGAKVSGLGEEVLLKALVQMPSGALKSAEVSTK